MADAEGRFCLIFPNYVRLIYRPAPSTHSMVIGQAPGGKELLVNGIEWLLKGA
jgi:hypothetical protein